MRAPIWRHARTVTTLFVARIIKPSADSGWRDLAINASDHILIVIILFLIVALDANRRLHLEILLKFRGTLINDAKVVLIPALKSIL